MSEALYDEKIGPMLLEVGKLCEASGLPFLAVVEYAPGEFGQSQFMPKDCSLPMTMANIAARCRGNLDAFMLSLLRHCRENSIDTSASIFARHAGASPSQPLPASGGDKEKT